MQHLATADAVIILKVEDVQWNTARALIQNSETVNFIVQFVILFSTRTHSV